MERLTKISWRNLDPWECCGQDDFCKRGCHDVGGCTNGCIVPKLYARLAAYEDTGLTPEEVKLYKKDREIREKMAPKHLLELEQAEKDGRLLVLPCKVGDAIWGADIYMEREDVREYTVREIDPTIIFEGHTYIPASRIGKDYFLTREEAEAALKKRETGAGAYFIVRKDTLGQGWRATAARRRRNDEHG